MTVPATAARRPNRRTVADCIYDVRAIADAFGIDRLAVWGISGGGPYALACAALLPDLVSAVASLASLAPWGEPDLDYFTGMGDSNEAWASLLSPADAAARTIEDAFFTVTSMPYGLAPGYQGWWDDSCAHLAPWGFALDAIRVPVQLRHGAQDRFVPFQHGQWLAEHIPSVDAHLTETDGHLTLPDRLPDIHAWLMQHS